MKNYFGLIKKSYRYRKANLYEKQALIGIADVIDGLCYHHANFLSMHKKIQLECGFNHQLESVGIPKEISCMLSHPDLSKIKHEISAYLCRVGQLYYFIKGRALNLEKFQTLDELIYYRHKYSAHRSLDKHGSESKTDRFHIDVLLGNQHAAVDKDGYTKFGYGDGKLNRNVDIKKQHPVLLQEVDSFFKEFFRV